MRHKIILVVILIICGLGIILLAKILLQSNNPTKYKIIVEFNSVCCGPPSDDFLKKYVNDFQTKNKVRISAHSFSRCGLEGEYGVGFTLSELNNSVSQNEFITGLKEKIVDLQDQDSKDFLKSELQIIENSSGTIWCKEQPKITTWLH